MIKMQLRTMQELTRVFILMANKAYVHISAVNL